MKLIEIIWVLVLTATVALAQGTNRPAITRTPFRRIDSSTQAVADGLRPSAGGKVLHYVCRVISVDGTELPDRSGVILGGWFLVEEGDAKGSKISLTSYPGKTDADNRLQKLLTQFVSGTSARVELLLAGELISDRAYLTTANGLFKGCAALDEAQHSAPASGASPHR